MTSEAAAPARFTPGLDARRIYTADASQGLRYDDSKNRMELIPPEWIEALGEVLTKGARKYADRNWEKGMAWSKMIGCTFRHMMKFLRGERYDAETGCHHLAHAAWNLLALMSYDVRGIGADDLPRARTSPTMESRP